MSKYSQIDKNWDKNLASRGYPCTFFCILVMGLLMLAIETGCRPTFLAPVRSVSQTEEETVPLFPSVTPVNSNAPTPTAQAGISAESLVSPANDFSSGRIILWVDETSVTHANVLEEMAAEFATEQQIQLEVLLVSPQLLPQLVQQAVISDTLPDLIIHPVKYSAGWAEQGILDPALATEALQNIGENTFDQESLNAVRSENDQVVAVPSHGWQSMLIYRSDWFGDLGLEPPADFASIMAAAEALYDPEAFTSGIVVPTDASLVTTQEVFEYFATANDCRLVEPGGRVALLHPACLEALEFYRALINQFSPIGFQTDISSLNAYLAGRTGMIISSPAVLPYLAGLVEQNKASCSECVVADYLVEHSGYISRLSGGLSSEESRGFSELTAMGFTSQANHNNALAFADYWFNEGYPKWLAVNPERKVPLRSGTQDQPNLFLDAWASSQLSPGSLTLEQIFGDELINQMSEDIGSSNRWGNSADEGRVASILYEDLLISPLLQDMLSGYFTSSETIVEMYKELVEAIPGYNFPVEIVPTPES